MSLDVWAQPWKTTEEKRCRQGGGYTGRRILKILTLLDRRKRKTTEKNLDMQRVVVREEKTRVRSPIQNNFLWKE